MLNTTCIRFRHRSRARGFSLIELLMVIGIMMVLTALMMTTLGMVRAKRKAVLATKQVKEIYAAVQQYYEELRCYPPDTGNFEADDTAVEPYAIHRYLGMTVVDEMGQKHGPFMTLGSEQLQGPSKTVDGLNDVELYCDPWGHPYQLDAMHVTVDPNTGAVTRIGEPYAAGTPDNQKTLSVKVWSYGPDGKNNQGSLAPIGKGVGDDADNITSWAD